LVDGRSRCYDSVDVQAHVAPQRGNTQSKIK
jgi:hypothetical protein